MIRMPYWPFLLVAVLLWVKYRRQRYREHGAESRLGRELFLGLVFAYGLAVAYVTLFPLTLFGNPSRTFNLNLFSEMRWLLYRPWIAFLNIAGNIVMFVPLGVFVPLWSRRLDRWALVGLAGLLCSFGIELVQYWTGERAADIDDIVLNTLGAVLGYGLFAAARLVAPGILLRIRNTIGG